MNNKIVGHLRGTLALQIGGIVYTSTFIKRYVKFLKKS